MYMYMYVVPRSLLHQQNYILEIIMHVPTYMYIARLGKIYLHCAASISTCSYWKAMKEIINTFFQLFSQMLSLVGILGVFILIFTTMGIRLFGDR
jgi:hypothetical protein